MIQSFQIGLYYSNIILYIIIYGNIINKNDNKQDT